jgi:hypothetical protein
MAIAILACMVLLGGAVVWLGFVPPPHANLVVRIREGMVVAGRGRLKPHAKEHVSDILNEAGVTSGFIAITPGNRVFFSRSIPGAVHQRLRNVLLNQWN